MKDYRLKIKTIGCLFALAIMMVILWPVNSVQAQEVGKTYDKTNYLDIQHLLYPALEEGVKNGEWLLKIGKFDFPLKHADFFVKESQANAGKFDLDDRGHLIDPKTGHFPEYNVYGMPFPNIDPKDPRVANKIIWNFNFQKYRFTSYVNYGTEIQLVDTKRRHRMLEGAASMLYWQGRMPGKTIENPHGYLSSDLQSNRSPMDMKGVSMLSHEFIDPKKDSIIYSYVPAVRRVRQMTGTARSDKVFGSDGNLDMQMMFSGKTATFDWSLLKEQDVLACFVKTGKDIGAMDPDGTLQKVLYQNRFGHETPGWPGVAWAPTESVWVKRPVWVIEGASRDPYYNFGRQIFYIDKELYTIWHREDFDKSGSFWQWALNCTHLTESPDGHNTLGDMDFTIIVDERIKHATITHYTPKNGGGITLAPASRSGPQYYTVQNMLRMAK